MTYYFFGGFYFYRVFFFWLRLVVLRSVPCVKERPLPPNDFFPPFWILLLLRFLLLLLLLLLILIILHFTPLYNYNDGVPPPGRVIFFLNRNRFVCVCVCVLFWGLCSFFFGKIFDEKPSDSASSGRNRVHRPGNCSNRNLFSDDFFFSSSHDCPFFPFWKRTKQCDRKSAMTLPRHSDDGSIPRSSNNESK